MKDSFVRNWGLYSFFGHVFPKFVSPFQEVGKNVITMDCFEIRR